jgi:hypothetical protein
MGSRTAGPRPSRPLGPEAHSCAVQVAPRLVEHELGLAGQEAPVGVGRPGLEQSGEREEVVVDRMRRGHSVERDDARGTNRCLIDIPLLPALGVRQRLLLEPGG